MRRRGILLAITLFSAACATNTTPFQLSLYHPIQLFPISTHVRGMRLNILNGRNVSVWGIDVGFTNGADEVRGLQIGVYNPVDGPVSGLQIASHWYNEATWLRGVQIAGVNSAGAMTGIQIATMSNYVNPGFHAGAPMGVGMTGVQIAGLWNDAGDPNSSKPGPMAAVQIAGLFNRTRGKLSGVQIGVVNVVDELSGVQIGLLNFNKAGPLRFFPLVNFAF